MTTKDEQLAELRQSNGEFLAHNNMAPQLVPQFRDIYMVKLLEHLIGPAVIDMQIAHEQWIAEQVGNLESAQRRAMLQQPPMSIGGERLHGVSGGRVTTAKRRAR